jgi:hypothetical protein
VDFSEQPRDDACTVGEAEQIAERNLTPVWNLDSRFHPRGNTRHGKPKRSPEHDHPACAECLGRPVPEPLDDVLEREAEQRVAELLDGLDE